MNKKIQKYKKGKLKGLDKTDDGYKVTEPNKFDKIKIGGFSNKYSPY
jgi:hypothetical protein